MGRGSINRLDKLIIGELAGPWAFGVAMFTVLIIAATYLFKITDYIVKGVSLGTVLELTLLFIPGVLVKTFAMAMLLAGLLGFGRLSSDSEVIAMRAAGASMLRIMKPVAAFALAVALVAFVVDETIVPRAASRSEALMAEILKRVDPHALHPTSQAIQDQTGNTVGYVLARDFDQLRGVLRDATVVVYNKDGTNQYYLYAKELAFDPQRFKDGGGWGIRGGADLVAGDGTSVQHFDDKVWPKDVPAMSFNPADILASQLKNLDVLNMVQIRTQISALKRNPKIDPSQIANLEFGYWNKIALPLAALIYGLLGAPLGIRSGRSSAAGGFALAVAIIFAYVTLANLLNVYASGGIIQPWVASFTPLAIGLVASGIIMWSRNR